MPIQRSYNGRIAYEGPRGVRFFDVRCNGITYGMKMLYAEDAAKTRKAFYPRMLAADTFSLSLVFLANQQTEKGNINEHKVFSTWMAEYAQYMLSFTGRRLPTMEVKINYGKNKNFNRRGLPLTGYSWEDRVGVITYPSVVTFQTQLDPIVRSAITGADESSLSAYVEATATDDALRYFNPAGEQLSWGAGPRNDVSFSTLLPGEVTSDMSDEFKPTSKSPNGGNGAGKGSY